MDFGGGGFGGGGEGGVGGGGEGGGFGSGPASGGFSSSDDRPGGRHGGSRQSGGSFGGGDFGDRGEGFGGGRESGGSFDSDFFPRDRDSWRSHFGWGPAIAGGAAGAAIASALANRTTGGRVTYYAAGQAPPSWPGYPSQWQGAPPQVRPAYPELTDQRPHSPSWLKLLPIINMGVVVVVFYLLFFAFGSEELQLGVKEQRLLKANSFFVTSIKVTPTSRIPNDLITSVLGFKSAPSLGSSIQWQEHFYHVPVRGYGYERWKFWLNRGSRVSLHYNIQRGATLLLVVLKGKQRMEEWKSSPNTFTDYEYRRRLSGDGAVTFEAESDGEFYIALGNFNTYPTTVNVMDVAVESRVYDLSRAASRCAMPPAKACSLQLPWGSRAVGVLATPLDSESEELWKVRVSYSARWMSYLWILALTWLATYVLGKLQKRHEARRARQLAQNDSPYPPPQEASSPRAPQGPPHPPETSPLVPPEGGQSPSPQLLPQRSLFGRFAVLNRLPSMFQSRGFGWRDEEAQAAGQEDRQRAGVPSAPIPSTWVAAGQEQSRGQNENQATGTISAYVGKGPETGTRGGVARSDTAPSAPPLDETEYVHEGLVVKGEAGGSANDTCAICMDAKKDSIFIDCGHRATCYSCGKMLMEATPPLCPICRKGIRQVIKVYDA